MNTYLYSFCLLLASFTGLTAQPDEFVIQRYLMKDGLAHDVTSCLFQDSQGFLWIGTVKGLNRFDGYQFTTYLSNPSDSNSLIDNVIFGENLWEDQHQRLWVGSTKGLDVLDLKTEKFHHLVFDSLADKKDGISVRKIQERKDGKVWICTVRGIYLADPATLSVERITSLSQGGNGNYILDSAIINGSFDDIAEARDGSVWAASYDGLFHWDASSNQTSHYRHNSHDSRSLGSNKVTSICIDRQDRVWVGTDRSFELFNSDERSFIKFLPPHFQGEVDIEDRFQVHALTESEKDKILVGSSDALYAFDLEDETFELLLDWYIWSVMKDRQGTIWAGSAQGLFQLAPRRKKFTVDRDYLYLSASKQTFIQYLMSKLPSQYPSNRQIHNIMPDEQGGGWLMGYYQLERFNSQYQIVSSYSVPFNAITILRDSRGMIWLGGSSESGIFNPQTETYKSVEAFSNIRVHSLLEDSQQNIWAATNRGLFRYNLRTKQIDQFRHNSTDPRGLSSNLLNCLLMDQSGTIWVGSNFGLNKMIPGTESTKPEFIRWQTSNSDLPHNIVNGMVEGGDGTIWLGCGNMIAHFYPQSGDFRTYDYQDGLNGLSILKGFKGYDERVYFISREGMISFHPDSLQDNPHVPPVLITNFSLHNIPVPLRGNFNDTLAWNTPLTQNISYTNELELSHQQNDFSFEFTALNYESSENNQYRYKLQPYEEQWIETTASNRIARYTNISPGNYTFRVIGSNNDGVWNEEGASLQLTILPPWWQTNWAYALYILLGIGLLYMLRQFTVKRERLKHALELQTIEAVKMHELDHLKSRFFANISHEFRTPLTLILGPLETFIQQSADSSSAHSAYRMMQRNAQRLLHLVNQLLDLSKLESGSMKLDTKAQPIVPFLKSLALSFASLAERRQIAYHFQFPTGNPVLYYDADKLEKIVTNLLSNAFKFTPNGGEVTVRIKLLSLAKGANERILELKIQDSGSGIPELLIERIFDRFYQAESVLADEQQGSGIGLSLVRELVELHQGKISVENTPPSGALFTVALPVKVADYEEIALNDTTNRQIVQEIETADRETSEESDEQLTERETSPLVLVVDDNADVRAFIRQTLQSDYRIQEATNGLLGLNVAFEIIPDLILSDVMMPEMDGVTLCEKIKTDERTSHIPIILLTAKASGNDKIAGLQTGADDYIIKPFQAEELRVRINNLINSRIKLREHFSRQITLEPKSIEITSVDEQFLQRVMQIVDANMADASFGVDAFSREVGMSRMQLFRKLKALTDHAPGDFIRLMRLKRAAELLFHGAGNIAEVAYLVGFQDPSYFTKCFQKQFGQTPSDYVANFA